MMPCVLIPRAIPSRFPRSEVGRASRPGGGIFSATLKPPVSLLRGASMRVAADGARFAKRRLHTQPVELGGDAGPEALQATPTRDVLTPGVERHALRPEPDPRR